MRTLCFYGALSTALCAALGCGEPFQAGNGAGGGTSSSTTTSSGLGGAGGDGGSSTGGGGQGGATGCGPGEFPRGDTCKSCSDLSGNVTFGTPVAIAVAGADPVFPRVRRESSLPETGARLIYAARFAGSDLDIGFALGEPWGEGTALVSAAINTSSVESGPLLLPEGAQVGGLPGGSLLFDGRNLFDNHRKVFGAAKLDETATREGLADVNVGRDSYSLAVAYASAPYRYWFMNRASDAAPAALLVTKIAGDPTIQALTIPLPGMCNATGADLAPWVTPDGAFLFFQSPYSPLGSCDASRVIRSFLVPLGPDGLPVAGKTAQLLLPTMAPDKQVMTPSLSPDLCTLYMVSDLDGEQKIYAAPRR